MPASKSPQAIDTHAHVFSATAPAVPGARYRPAYAATLDGWRSRWESAGITRGVLVQPSFFGADNGEMLVALAATFNAVRELAASRAVWCKLSAPYRLEGWEPHALVVRWLDAVAHAALWDNAARLYQFA